MSLSNLTKDQKKYIVIGLIGGIVVVVFAVIGIQFSLSSIAAAKLELADLTTKIENADTALAKRDQAKDEYDQTVTRLKDHFAGLPPEKNYYSWATGIIYSTGRNSGLEIESVDEVINSSKDKVEDVPIKLSSYTVRITAHGSYEQVKLFLQNLGENHPLVRISGIEIGIGPNLSSHNVQVYVQWPFSLDAITQVWDEVASKQRKIAIREIEKPAPERKTAQQSNETIEKETMPVAIEPEPVPVPEPAPEVVKPEPAIVAPVVAKSEPVVVAPVVPEPEPFIKHKPLPAPEIKKPEPVIAPVVAAVDPEPVPAPANELESMLASLEEPNPVVAAVVPEPKPVVKPKPEVKDVDSPKTVVAPIEPAPVVAAVAKEPKPVAESPPENENLDSLLSSYAYLETGTEVKKTEPEPERYTAPEPVQEPEPEPEEPMDEFGTLLASLGSHSDELPEPGPEKEASSDPEELKAFLQQMTEEKEPIVAPHEEVIPAVSEPSAIPTEEKTVNYVSSEKSAKILQELLHKEEPKEAASLSSFLNTMVEDINE